MLKDITPTLRQKLGNSVWPYNILYIVPYCVKLLYLIYTKALVRDIKIKLVKKKHKQMETETKNE